MAEVVEEVIAQIQENLTATVEGAVEEGAATNAPGKTPSTPEGMALAYGTLVVMALLPIFFGSLRSVKHHKEQSTAFAKTGEKPDTMSSKDAMMFPIMASCALFGLYMFFKIFSKENINYLLTGYFFFLGVMALSHLLSPVISSLIPASIPKIPYHLSFVQGPQEGGEKKSKEKKYLIDYRFTTHDVVCFIVALIISVWYLVQKHWIANNLLGLSFAVNGVELLHLNNIATGCILLCGLFVYDIFWVFGTNVMVTVAKSFEAPIKIVFPQDLMTNGLSASNFAVLGLGDIVIPGIFIALLLRFDNSLKRKSKTYFYATFIAYFVGLLATIFVMHVFKHAQPALLYLVPACLGTPLLLAVLKGDLKKLLAYEDHPEEKPKVSKKENNANAEKSTPPAKKETKAKKEAKKAK
ncbi:LOW QUALITY PROTEIN: minor histocompatibility antigen H13-like [Anopheles stephensi]|uniref:LOW QUALITY PROTEIN: minor histocompatibility antigen H13-like n=1 Tax=Anopheles stephensi TaxID=30069 RepID=UPI001658862A|nr:LOW QUALITY PROTEIN: minor histocompatibility antigen H13-like [Anopheles stephensi]